MKIEEFKYGLAEAVWPPRVDNDRLNRPTPLDGPRAITGRRLFGIEPGRRPIAWFLVRGT